MTDPEVLLDQMERNGTAMPPDVRRVLADARAAEAAINRDLKPAVQDAQKREIWEAAYAKGAGLIEQAIKKAAGQPLQEAARLAARAAGREPVSGFLSADERARLDAEDRRDLRLSAQVPALLAHVQATKDPVVLGALFDDIHVTSHDFTLRLVGAAIVERLQAIQIDRRTPATVREAATQVANRVVHEHGTWQREHPSVRERIRALEREATGIESALRSGWALALRAYGYAPPAERGETQEGKVFDRIDGRRLGDVPPPAVPPGATVQGPYWERGH